MHIIKFHSENVLSAEEGSILKYIACEYDKDRMNYGHVFQVIGDPVTGDNASITHYSFPNEKEGYKTYIKVI